MIPKKIHYCWFGKGELPELARKCIDSWKKILPEYEIIEWNEEKFDINSNSYVRQAYENKKYAFVSDYVRLYALYKEGGIYMDTDVEVIKKLDKFLNHEVFTGFEDEEKIPTGIIGAEKHNPLIKELLEYYTDRSFVREDGSLDMTTNVRIITDILSQYNFLPNNTLQEVRGMYIYPRTYFCPLTWNKNESYYTSDTHVVHHFAGSWRSERQKKIQDKKIYIALKKYLEKICIIIKKTCNEKVYNRLRSIYRKIVGYF